MWTERIHRITNKFSAYSIIHPCFAFFPMQNMQSADVCSIYFSRKKYFLHFPLIFVFSFVIHNFRFDNLLQNLESNWKYKLWSEKRRKEKRRREHSPKRNWNENAHFPIVIEWYLDRKLMISIDDCSKDCGFSLSIRVIHLLDVWTHDRCQLSNTLHCDRIRRMKWNI